MSTVGYFGPPEGIDSKDYLFLMQGPKIISRPEPLIGHSLTNPSVDLTDSLKVNRVELSRGRIRTITITKRAPEVRGYSYTIGFPSGALWTPALAAAARPGCRNTFFLKYLCPTDDRYSHVHIYPDGTLSPPVEEGDIVTVDDTNMITHTSTLESPRKDTLFKLQYEKLYTETSKELHAVTFTTAECPSCADVPGLGLIAVGGDGTAAASNLITDDRFTSVTKPAAGGSGNYGTDVFQDGSLVVTTYADETTPAGGTGATAGGIAVSNNGWLTNPSLVSGITAPMYGVTKLGGTLIAVGGTGAGAAKVYYSIDDGATWTEYTGTLPSTDAFTSIAADNQGYAAYIVGEGGKLFKATAPGRTITLVDISSSLPGSPGVLYVVKVLGENHVIVGGASGYVAESVDGGASWAQISVAGSTAVHAIGGNRFRTIVAAGTAFYERSPLTDNQFVAGELESGQTISGDIKAIAIGVDGDFNLITLVTDAGEVVLGHSYLPNS